MADMTTSSFAMSRSEDGSLKALLLTFFTAGAAAFLAFDFFGQVLSPMFGYSKLAPVGLANSTIKALFGASYSPGAHGLHFMAGLLAYPLGWLLVAEPIRKRFTPFVPTFAAAVAYGVGLWIFALFIMAHLIAGMPAFLNWTGITWVALWGHILYAVVFVLAWNGLRGRASH